MEEMSGGWVYVKKEWNMACHSMQLMIPAY
jgi:hypothetical protein